jgi:hypothetical protein
MEREGKAAGGRAAAAHRVCVCVCEREREREFFFCVSLIVE